MEEGDQLPLQLGLQVDEQVAAAQQIQAGEGWVHHQVLLREDHHLANFLSDPVAVPIFDKEALEAVRGDVSGDPGRVDPVSSAVDRGLVQIGGEDLQDDMGLWRQLIHDLLEQHREAVGLFTSRTAGHPGPDHAALGMCPDDGWHHLLLDALPHRRIAEEAGDADQELLEQQVGLLPALPEDPHIVGDARELVQPHPPLDAAHQGALAVEREVVSGALPQKQHHLGQATPVIGGLGFFMCRTRAGQGRVVVQEGEDAARQLFGRGHHVGEAGVDGAAWHRVESGRGRRLDEYDTGVLLDRAQAQGAIGAHSREDDPHRQLSEIGGQAAQKVVDGQTQTACTRRLQQVQDAVEQRKIVARRDHVDVVW